MWFSSQFLHSSFRAESEIPVTFTTTICHFQLALSLPLHMVRLMSSVTWWSRLFLKEQLHLRGISGITKERSEQGGAGTLTRRMRQGRWPALAGVGWAWQVRGSPATLDGGRTPAAPVPEHNGIHWALRSLPPSGPALGWMSCTVFH